MASLFGKCFFKNRSKYVADNAVAPNAMTMAQSMAFNSTTLKTAARNGTYNTARNISKEASTARTSGMLENGLASKALFSLLVSNTRNNSNNMMTENATVLAFSRPAGKYNRKPAMATMASNNP